MNQTEGEKPENRIRGSRQNRFGLRACGCIAAIWILCLLTCCAPKRETEPAEGKSADPTEQTLTAERGDNPEAVTATGTMSLLYAEQFQAEDYSDGSVLLTIAGTERFLIVPQGMERPAHHPEAPVIFQPVERVYLAASSAMDLFVRLNAIHQVSFTSTEAENWSIPDVRSRMAAGDLRYAGKYSAPDYELLLEEGVDLTVESTMITHAPAVREKLETLGIPVLVERSSYEPHPMGRVEWIKVYGLLTGRRAEAERYFDEEAARLEAVEDGADTGKTAAFFYLNASGMAVVRRSGDYVSKMMELAGGRSVFDRPEASDSTRSGVNAQSALSTANMQMEAFYAGARDADILIYNATVDGGPETLGDLMDRCPLLEDFRAVRTGRVWCTERNLFQQSSATAGVIRELRDLFSGEEVLPDRMEFFHRLR